MIYKMKGIAVPDMYIEKLALSHERIVYLMTFRDMNDDSFELELSPHEYDCLINKMKESK